MVFKKLKNKKYEKNYFIFNICLTSLRNYGINILVLNYR